MADTPVPEDAPVEGVSAAPPELAGPQSVPALRLFPDDVLFCTLRVLIAAPRAADPVAAGGGQSTVAPEPAPGAVCGVTGLSNP